MQRYDTYTIRAITTDEGFIKDTPIIGRSGLLRYLNADGTERIEYRPPEEAFSEDSLASIAGKPITLGHRGMVKADNVKSVQPIGSVLSGGKQDGNDIRADIVIYTLPTDARELSCGYSLDLEERPGTTPDGLHYDAIQRNIRYNHLAVVPRGRAGNARLNMDGDQELEGGIITMEKIKLDSGLEYDAAPEVKIYLEKVEAEKAEQTKKLDELQAKYDSAIAEIEKEKAARADEAEKAKAAFDEAVKARIELIKVADKHGVKADGLTDKEIRVAVIKAVRGDALNLDGKSDDYIAAAFDMAAMDVNKDSMAGQRKAINTKAEKHDDDFISPADALEALIKEEAGLYMKEVK